MRNHLGPYHRPLDRRSRPRPDPGRDHLGDRVVGMRVWSRRMTLSPGPPPSATRSARRSTRAQARRSRPAMICSGRRGCAIDDLGRRRPGSPARGPGASATNANERNVIAVQSRACFRPPCRRPTPRAATVRICFAGSKSDTQPFDASGVYQGDAATRSVNTSEHGSDPVSVAGSTLTAAHGVDVLPELSEACHRARDERPPDHPELPRHVVDGDTQVSSARGQAGADSPRSATRAIAPAARDAPHRHDLESRRGRHRERDQ